ncbi:Alpha-amylase/alpha-mannosidase, GH57 family [Methylobacillus rhizosphaerae]|uniref:Alpha-amylase/alpha-mannosidase, GH57 family n=1 Tax=Methylobacillus rhizosphaerae TaxID=551994 RepID=A0A238ZKW9_9PROT|nr:glycoside hydrolase family 57 protein [Methylobacillus rhizosphaerae]SNR84045.1 Alpha-amylase/alpha-mannosidase, GH57 family [Methylobacillus rhizosphaerae]
MTASHPKLYLNLYWHMHQPDYRDSISGEYVLPWTYLHAIKDYTDMAYHLESNPAARVSFNFVPVLLDQLEDYADQFNSGKIRDPLLALLLREDMKSLTLDERCLILESCFKGHHEKMLAPFEHYQCLYNMYTKLEPRGKSMLNYLSGQYMADLIVWYHLAWTGESVRRNSSEIQMLMNKGSQFTLEDRQVLFRVMADLIRGLIPRYRALEATGRIEISTTPHYHPILPLLLDFRSTRDAMPYAPLPRYPQYPGGRQRACAHVQEAQEFHQHRFGKASNGMWPAEGAVSQEALILLAQHGVKWAATGEGVLANSLYKSFDSSGLPPRHEYLYKPYRVGNEQDSIMCFFRDDQLSDKIGFEYANLHADSAVADFVHHLEQIYEQHPGEQPPIVSVILDGENAWEYYPYNGYYFLSQLYTALSTHEHITMTTPSDLVQRCLQPDSGLPIGELPAVAAGSWVYGSFSTWIGSSDKNKGWDLLCEAKQAYDRVVQQGALTEAELAAATRQLAICEGSDWFWWFGDYNSGLSVSSFDHLFRRNLSNLYHLLQLDPPHTLDQAISAGSASSTAANAGTMRRGQSAESST